MSDRDLHARASELFARLRRLPEAERSAALAAAGDEVLRREVASWLAHDVPCEEPGEAPAEDPEPEPQLGVPDRIGPYRILRAIGRGGSGHVFLAEQSEPVARQVALKVVPLAAVSPTLAARFEVERHALERTDHSAIARILDAGRTADGLPYLAMEYVEGAPITRYCDEHGLDLQARLRLVLEVADAVQHAHQRGVIHRDLKPDNVLVRVTDGCAAPVVLDFGIAKHVEESGEDVSPLTSGLPLGTPSYMAPEQTGREEVDTRVDVYALGVLLYELATGNKPIDGRGDPLAVLQRIREQAAPPITRRAGAAQHAPAALVADLACVVARALEKDRERRYPTVAALGEDLRRLLRSEPIEARAPSLGYRAARFVRRNRGLTASLAAVAVALVVGVAGLVVGLREAEAERDAQQLINRFLNEDLLAAASPDRDGKDVTALDLLQRASARVEQRFAGRPRGAAAVHDTLGGAFALLGALDEAEHHHGQALQLRLMHLGADAPLTVRSEIAVASLLVRRERLSEAEPALRAAIERARAHLGADAPELYSALNDLGVVLDGLDQPAAAIAVLSEALDGRRRLLGERHPEVLATTANLAVAYSTAGDDERYMVMLHDALAIAEALPDEPRATLIGLCSNIAVGLLDADRFDDAAPYLERAEALALEVLGPDHPDTITVQANRASLEADRGNTGVAKELYDRVIAFRRARFGDSAQPTLIARYGRWNASWKAGEHAAAAAGFTTLLDDVTAALPAEHWLVPQTRAALAHALFNAGRLDAAAGHARAAAAALREQLGEDHHRSRSAAALVARIEQETAARTGK